MPWTIVENCPVCGEENVWTDLCGHCGADLAEEDERLSKVEIEEYLQGKGVE